MSALDSSPAWSWVRMRLAPRAPTGPSPGLGCCPGQSQGEAWCHRGVHLQDEGRRGCVTRAPQDSRVGRKRPRSLRKSAMSPCSAKKPQHVSDISHSLLRGRKRPVTPDGVSAVLLAASQEKYAGEAAHVVGGGGGRAVRAQEAVRSGLERG